MKKYILVLAAACVSASVSAQHISTDKVPAPVTAAFKSKFPDAAKVKWEIENKNEYEAEFELKGSEMSTSYDPSGKWLQTETDIQVTELPSAVTASIHKDFPDHKINEASKISSLKYGTCYEAEVQKGKEQLDIVFSAEGKLLSKEQSDEDKDDKE